MNGEYITDFSYRFTPWPSMSKLEKRRVTKEDPNVGKLLKMVRADNTPIDLGKHSIGPVKFKAYIFDREARILELGVQDK
ncbi:hypothetical protein ABTH94_21545, partial [Acinetobacter baumannii]